MKRVITAILAMILLFLPQTAMAAAFTDIPTGASFVVPNDIGVMYYTPETNNIDEELLKNIESSGDNIRFLVNSYSQEKALLYSFEMISQPLSQIVSGEANAADDIFQMSAEGKEKVVSQLTERFSSKYAFEEPVDSAAGGCNAIMIPATVKDSPSYACNFYLLTHKGQLITLILLYQKDEYDIFLNQGLGVLQTLTFGDAKTEQTAAPEPTPTAAPTMEPTPTIEPPPQQSEESISGSVVVLEKTEEQSSIRAFLAWLVENPIYMAALIGVYALVVVLIVFVAKKK